MADFPAFGPSATATLAPEIPVDVALSVTCPLSVKAVGAGAGVGVVGVVAEEPVEPPLHALAVTSMSASSQSRWNIMGC